MPFLLKKQGVLTWVCLVIVGVANGQTNPYLGSVPSGTVSPNPVLLSLEEAIARGLKTNLGAVLADQRTLAAQGERLVARSQLLPYIGARTSESSNQINLAAYGFPAVSGFPQIVGPFGVFDLRGAVSQSVLNFRSIHETKASTQALKSSELQAKDARDAIALTVTALYLQAQASASRIDTSRAQVAAAEALYNQAVDFKKSGVSPAIDVLRSQVELEAQRQRLIAAENQFEKDKLQLARAIGLPDGQALRLTDQIPYQPANGIPVDDAIQRSYQSRMDYQSLEARVRAAEQSLKAAEAGRLPSISFNGDYGVLGQSPTSSHGTYTAAISLNVPLYTGGRVKGETLEAESALREQKAQLDDLRARIGFEIRSSLLDVTAAGKQVEVSRNAITLAGEQQAQARDRFAAGVTNNLEVVQAQEAFAGANENYISSLYAFNLAKASLARAIGGVEKTIPSLLLGSKQ
jgi:outer membrane protein TolC